MSSRSIYFFDQLAVFKCGSATWREDLILETETPGVTLVEDRNPSPIAGNQFDDPEGFADTYGWMLQEYAGRHLTHDTDVFDACMALLSRTIKYHVSKSWNFPWTVYALPLPWFDWSLLWRSSMDIKPVRRQANIPSWSWCTWRCPMGNVEESLNDFQLEEFMRNRSWIRWVLHNKADASGAMQVIDVSSSRYGIQSKLFSDINRFPPVQDSTTCELRSEDAYATCNSPENAMLHFSTWSLDLHILTSPIKDVNDVFYWGIGVDQVIGYCRFDDSDFSPPRTTLLLALALSLSSGSFSDFQTSKFQHASQTTKCEFYHVMLTKAGGKTNEPCQRLGIGYVSRVSMDTCSRAKWRQIWLE